MRPAHAHDTTGRRPTARRGVTLLEMLVVLGLLVLMMAILALIFQRTTGAIQGANAYGALDQELRRLDTTIRRDLEGVTAKMTPPNDPGDNRGYFEYAENALSDLQGEDTDDTLRFTVQAPVGEPFVSRIWLPRSVPDTDNGYTGARSTTFLPTSVTSQFAEVIYFLRNGNLYRRVLLIAPERANNLGIGNTPTDPDLYLGGRPGPQVFGFRTTLFNPFSTFTDFESNGGGFTPRTALGSAFVSWIGLNGISARPRDYPPSVSPTLLGIYDYIPTPNTLGDLTSRENRWPNPRHADDYFNNGTGMAIPDGLPDDLNGDGVLEFPSILYPNLVNGGFLNERGTVDGDGDGYFDPIPSVRPNPTLTYDAAAFPYIYPNSYSQPATPNLHVLDPALVVPGGRPYFGTYLDPPFNHNPIPDGDSLATPNGVQTWWGFPTWRETMSPYWLDPIKRLNDPPGSSYFMANSYTQPLTGPVQAPEAGAAYLQTPGLSYRFLNGGTRYPLPPMDGNVNTAQPFNDGSGGAYFAMPPTAVWEEDLLATNVRSFDVKAFDPSPKMIDYGNGNALVNLPPGYYDLGYANLDAFGGTPSALLDSFAHEGRMPPLTTDFRSDPQFPSLRPNIGDDNNSVLRLRRVWDSWSTTYSIVPGLPLNPLNGPLNGLPPVYPSYPAPYPSPLRAIQVEIRVSDPGGARLRVLTITQDFTDKL